MSGLDQKQAMKAIEDQGQTQGSISQSLSELMENLSDEEQHNLFSELSDREIKHISVIATAGGEDELTKEFLRQYKTLKVSKKRRGRKELVNIADAFSSIFEAEQGEGKLSRIRGAMGL